MRGSAQTRISERDVLLFAAGTISAIVYFAVLPRSIGGGGEPVAVAESIVKFGRFADPFVAKGSTGPTAHLPPLLPIMLAAWYWLFGKSGMFAILCCVAIAHGLQAALLPRISEQLFGRPQPGCIGALAAVALPIALIEPLWENMYSGAALLAFCFFVRKITGLRDGAKIGIACGLLLLLNPCIAVVILCWIVYVLCANWPGWTSLLKAVSVATIACALILLPWEIRNYRQLGGFVFVRDNFGLELNAANNDCAKASFVDNMNSGCETLVHPIVSTKQNTELKSMGELNYNRDRGRRALHWIASHPARFRQLVQNRIFFFWFPPGRLCAWVITVLSFAGIAIAFAQRYKAASFALASLALFPLPYYAIQMSERFRYPVLWISLLFAGYALEALHRKGTKPMAEVSTCSDEQVAHVSPVFGRALSACSKQILQRRIWSARVCRRTAVQNTLTRRRRSTRPLRQTRSY